MPMEISFAEGDRVVAHYKGHAIVTDQDGSLPAPFDLFLASIGTCTGYYVSRFCRERGIPVDGIRLEQRRVLDPARRMIERIELEIRLPEGFPERYRAAVVRAANLCSVKKHLEEPPEIHVSTTVPSASSG